LELTASEEVGTTKDGNQRKTKIYYYEDMSTALEKDIFGDVTNCLIG